MPLEVSGHVLTLEDHPFNTSDHLPLMCTLELRTPTYTTSAFPSQRLDWAQGEASQCTVSYANLTDDIARPLLCKIAPLLRKLSTIFDMSARN